LGGRIEAKMELGKTQTGVMFNKKGSKGERKNALVVKWWVIKKKKNTL